MTLTDELPDWRGKARELLPELDKETFRGIEDTIDGAENPMALWIRIFSCFRDAYHELRDESIIRRIYTYADWCLQQPRTPNIGWDGELATPVTVCFYEDIPTIPAARADMLRWFTPQKMTQYEGLFRYSLTESQWKELLMLWDSRPRHPAKKKLRSR